MLDKNYIIQLINNAVYVDSSGNFTNVEYVADQIMRKIADMQLQFGNQVENYNQQINSN